MPRATEYLLTHNDIAEDIPGLPNPEAKEEADPDGELENLQNIFEQIMHTHNKSHENNGSNPPPNNPGS